MPISPSPAIARHFGLDWLRIGAFALLILFHVGLYFAPGHWIVKSPQEAAWAAWPLAAIVPWRLTVLFAVSGYATAAMMQRYPGLGAFLAERARRLLIPLLFGMLVIVPPQDWVRLELAGIDHAYLRYLAEDYFSFGMRAGVFFPNWEHLWFLPYLLAYTALLTGFFAFLPQWRALLEPAVLWLAQGRRLLYLPAALIFGSMAPLSLVHLDGLPMGELVGTADYLPAFVFGVAYAHYPQLREAVSRLFGEAALASLASLVTIWWLMAAVPIEAGWLQDVVGLAPGSLMSWAMLITMFRLADRFLNFDHKLRQPLAAAVFPAYIVHQTIIVVVGWYLARWGIVGIPALLAQLGAVTAGCLAAWWLATLSPITGILLGMPRRERRRSPGETAPQPA